MRVLMRWETGLRKRFLGDCLELQGPDILSPGDGECGQSHQVPLGGSPRSGGCFAATSSLSNTCGRQREFCPIHLKHMSLEHPYARLSAKYKDGGQVDGA